jgi:hypothetical protein
VNIAKLLDRLTVLVPPASPARILSQKGTKAAGKFFLSSSEQQKGPNDGTYEWITKETLVYRHSYLNPMHAVFDDVTNCDAGFD